MENETKIIVSKSNKKRKLEDGTIKRTQQVIYKTKLSNGKFESRTKHETFG